MIIKLQESINKNKKKVNSWLTKQLDKVKDNPLPIYSSFDLRDNGCKLSIVDSNLFPAGFNNLGKTARKKAVDALKEYLSKRSEKDILIIPEAHTRNAFYLSNLCAIQTILQRAGYNAVIGTIREDLKEDTIKVEDSEGHKITLEKIRKDDCYLRTKTFNNGLILLNNDFSVQNPPLLDNVCQPILPPLKLGWMHRKKTTHFKCLNSLIKDFSQMLKVDPWFFSAIYKEVDNVDFKNKDSLQTIAKEVDILLNQIKEKYIVHNHKQDPYVFVKDNSGTYGMGIIVANSGKDILELNSKKRSKMVTGKQKSKITSVIIQEGILTRHKVQNHPAEPVIYSAGGKVVGGFMRVHSEKDAKRSLNAPGAKFDLLLKDSITKSIIDHFEQDADISLYSLMADIANIAIAHEYKNVS